MMLFSAEGLGLHYSCRPEPAFQDITLDIREGEDRRLTGPSGAGKTSLMRVIAGLEHPTSGQISISAKNVGMAFAEPRLLPQLTVMENLLFVAPQSGKALQKMLEMLTIDDLRDSKVDGLSKGQAQRVALIRCLSVRPQIVLLDEALGGLDHTSWVCARDLITRQRQANAFALVEISHDPARLIAPDARIVSLEQGFSV